MRDINIEQAEAMLQAAFKNYLEHNDFSIDLQLLVFNLFSFGKASEAIRESITDDAQTEDYQDFLTQIHLSEGEFIEHWRVFRKVRPHTKSA